METTIEVENEEQERRWRDKLAFVRTVPVNAFRAYAGFWGMAYDEAQEMLKRSRDVLDRAEDRGEVVEDETRQRVREVVDKVQRRAEEAEEELQERMEEVKEQVNLATREEVAALNAKVDALRRQVDVLLGKIDEVIRATQEEPAPLPLPGYDDLTAKEVVAQLDAMTIPQLFVLRDYELGKDKRVTVVREMDARINRMPIPGYDGLTVEEIEPLLPALDGAQLAYVARYEEKHENRVTLLRIIERGQERRIEVTA